jgi:hypothetical protein
VRRPCRAPASSTRGRAQRSARTSPVRRSSALCRPSDAARRHDRAGPCVVSSAARAPHRRDARRHAAALAPAQCRHVIGNSSCSSDDRQRNLRTDPDVDHKPSCGLRETSPFPVPPTLSERVDIRICRVCAVKLAASGSGPKFSATSVRSSSCRLTKSSKSPAAVGSIQLTEMNAVVSLRALRNKVGQFRLEY